MARKKKQQIVPFEGQVAEVGLVYKTTVKASQRTKVCSTREAEKVFRRHWNQDTLELQEEMKVLYLNRTNHVLGIYPLSAGGINATLVDPRLVMMAGIRLGASYMILCHNHPSGNLKPSLEDKKLTYQIKAGAALLDMKLVDHIILTQEGYYSFSEEEAL